LSSISDYYWHAPIYEPPDFTSREFGFRKNSEKMVRHKAFSSVKKLRTFLIETSPDHVYFSSSKYADPAAYPMEVKKKSWIGSDLVFDIDYDHLKRPTLREAKKQSEKLMLILMDDLGFKKLLYVDSGSRGFHVHVHDECVQKLGNPERREIADFFGHYKTKRERKIINPNWVEIDTVVTTDFIRLIRLPGSLNVKPDSARPCAIIR
jgi:DNA primase small subunit